MSASQKCWSTLFPGCTLRFDPPTPELHVPSRSLERKGRPEILILSAHHIQRGAILISSPQCACLLWHMGNATWLISAF